MDWQLLLSEGTDLSGLLRVQRALVQFAAARGDAIALLGLPKDYRSTHALRYQQQLSQVLRTDGDTTDSYAALYHPWLISREPDGVLLQTHPAGSMAGIMAKRSLSKGSWIAPANEVIQDVLSTVESLDLAQNKICTQWVSTLFGSDRKVSDLE